MRGHTQLPMVAPGWMSPQGGTAGRANPTTRLQDGGRLPGLRCGDGRAEGRATAASPGAGRGAEPPRIASAADGRRCGGRRGTRGSKHRRGAAQGPARLPRPPPGLLSAPTPASGPPPPRPRPRASVQPRGESSSAGRGGGQQHAEGGGERPGLRDPQEGPGRPRPTYTSARRRPPAPARPPAPGL